MTNKNKKRNEKGKGHGTDGKLNKDDEFLGCTWIPNTRKSRRERASREPASIEEENRQEVLRFLREEGVVRMRDVVYLEQAAFNAMNNFNKHSTAYFRMRIANRCRGVVSHSAARRLVREIAKIERDPTWGVSAMPLEGNLLLWHCNLSAPGGVTGKGVLHVELQFPPTYPACPPKVKILGSNVDHPNVFGSYICLDLLNKGEFSGMDSILKPFTGWSAAYGVQTLLVQLQSFFFSGVDTGYGKGGRIKIRQQSGAPVWEYQLKYSECHHWSHFAFDESAPCRHRSYNPQGMCYYGLCDGKGAWAPKWVSLHQQDMCTLETGLNLYEDALKRDEEREPDASLEAPLYRKQIVENLVLPKNMQPSQASIAGVVKYARGINITTSYYCKCKSMITDPCFETHLRVEVSFGESLFKTRDFSSIISCDEGHSVHSESAGPQTPAWFEHFALNKKALKDSNVQTNVVFTVYNSNNQPGENRLPCLRSWEAIAVASLPIATLTEENKEVVLKLYEPKSLSKKGKMCGSLVIDARIAQPQPTFEFDFQKDAIDGTMSFSSCFGQQRVVRRREGYRCEKCDHTPIERVPNLPSAIDCDDAPPFALKEFHEALSQSVGNNDPEALAAVDRCVASLQKELDEKNGIPTDKKHRHSNIFYIPDDVMMVVMEYLPRNRERRYLSQIFSPWTVLYKDARFWEAQHLKCFTTGATPSEDILGIGVLAAEAMHGRPVFSCQFDPISKTAYNEGVRIGVWKERFTHWVPLYINKNHADRSMKEFIPQLKKLSVGVRTGFTKEWAVDGGDLEGKGKDRLVRLPGKKQIFRSTGWSGIRGGNFAASGSHYFQIEVINYSLIPNLRVAGKFAAHGVVKIGWITVNGDVNIGTDDQGFCFSTQGVKVHGADREEYGKKVAPGDVVGTLWDASSRKISFFLNGQPLGVAFNVPRKGYPGLIPAVAISHATIEVDIEGGYNPPCVVECDKLLTHSEDLPNEDIKNCLTVLPQLMNHMVVEVMKGQLHASVKALNGYCALHRLFLYTADLWPELQETVENTLRRFIDYPSERHKVITPDLGVILCLLTISKKYSWKDLKNSFLSELFTRHVRWSLKKSRRFAAGQLHPRMAKDHEMIAEAFYANETSCKLVMFQVFFANLVKPCEEYFTMRDNDPFSHTKELYDSRMGFPTTDMVDALVSEITLCNSRLEKGWNGFLQSCGGERRTNADIAKRIRDAVSRSDIAGYHDDVVPIDSQYAARILRMPPRNGRKPAPGQPTTDPKKKKKNHYFKNSMLRYIPVGERSGLRIPSAIGYATEQSQTAYGGF
eukprot:TRINITY_DN1958_c0_g2_i1.p1 TRINITY_DN1958_c0_g2~~TRINITY_DN1958_c0_g2_i1.p1  ORF type:complete len:1319 (+),score=228.19 TRINITY_DN1958_c0_g2_i1:51-3959(+)